MKKPNMSWLLLLSGGLAVAQEKPALPAAIDGVKGVKQEAVQSIKKVEPPTASATPVNTAQGVNKVDGVNTVNGVKADGRDVVMPVPPPPPAGVVSTIRAVQGVQGINAPKQKNLEAALLIKEGKGIPAGNARAAAALFNGPPGGKPVPNGDGRAGFQEFEKLTAPGS